MRITDSLPHEDTEGSEGIVRRGWEPPVRVAGSLAVWSSKGHQEETCISSCIEVKLEGRGPGHVQKGPAGTGGSTEASWIQGSPPAPSGGNRSVFCPRVR